MSNSYDFRDIDGSTPARQLSIMTQMSEKAKRERLTSEEVYFLCDRMSNPASDMSLENRRYASNIIIRELDNEARLNDNSMVALAFGASVEMINQTVDGPSARTLSRALKNNRLPGLGLQYLALTSMMTGERKCADLIGGAARKNPDGSQKAANLLAAFKDLEPAGAPGRNNNMHLFHATRFDPDTIYDGLQTIGGQRQGTRLSR